VSSTVLNDVRIALGRSAPVTPEPLPPFVEPGVASDISARIDRFEQEAAAVRARIHRCAESDLAEKIAEICAPLNGEVAISGLPFDNLKGSLQALGLSIFDGANLNHEQLIASLANCVAGVTAADYAIAETGTIGLSSDEENALLVSLLPPVHIALLKSAQISATLAEVIALIGTERSGRRDPARSVSFITGPSRTSDVELVLSIGVHGPKELHVIIFD
jgi:L-lactate dehydrogenase complex protein LldG